MSRSAELLRTTPLSVLFIITLCTLTYCWQVIYQPVEHNFTICPQKIIFEYQIYRMITSSFLHGNLFHIAMNMMSFLQLGTILERSFGTVWHLSIILWSVVLTNSTFVFIAFTMYLCGMEGEMNGHALGFSGTLFHLMVIQCHLNASSTHSILGMFQVSSKVYPWVLLIGIQIILPNISFLGHLSGILVGQMHTAGLLNCILPSVQRLRSLDDSNKLRRFSCRDNFIKTPRSNNIFETTFSMREFSSIAEGRAVFVSYISVLCKFSKDIAETLKVMIFGRGQEANQNIRLNEAEMSSLLVGMSNSEDICEEDDDWVGLENVPLTTEVKDSEYV